MNVVIDIGNTCIKWARADGERIEERGAAVHRDSRRRALDALTEALPERVDAVAVANVAGSAMAQALTDRLREARGVTPRFFAAGSGGGLRSAYEEPARLGADRWAAMVAAHRRFPGPVCIVDAGTTVTFDAVDAEGQHLGGLILAGPRLVADAFERNTEQIRVEIAPAGPGTGLDVLGKSTAAAVGRGAMLAVAGAIDRAAEAVGDALGLEPTLLLTGGDAGSLGPWLRTPARREPDLVLQGLACLLSGGGGR
jgi:type III pantothenate kinase